MTSIRLIPEMSRIDCVSAWKEHLRRQRNEADSRENKRGRTDTAVAKVEDYHGAPAIMINGSVCPPMTITLRSTNRQYLKDLRAAGIRVFYINTMTNWNNPGGKKEDYPYADANRVLPENGIEYTQRAMDALTEAVPDAYVMLRLNVAPPVSWVNSHPEEMVTFSDGTHRPVTVTTVARGMELDGMPSLCSPAWRREAAKALDEYFDAITECAWFDRVAGFFLCAGGTSEWYYPQQLIAQDGAYGDFSEPFRQEFEAYLREKYGTEEALRKAWRIPDATFEHPLIPDLNARTVIEKADQDICADLSAGFSVHDPAYNVPLDTDKPVIGTFLNMNRYAVTADFYDAWHMASANSVIYFAGLLKKRFPDLLVGAFYGSYGCTEYFNSGTVTGTPRIMRSGMVDFLAAPGVYNNREPGGVVAQREMQDSFRLHHMMYISEDDIRTHHIQLWVQRDAMGLYSVRDTVTVLKRDFARDICEDIHAWWFDMGGEWYNDAVVLALFRRQQEIAAYACSLDRTKRNEIAIIYDTESVHCVSESVTQLVTDFYRTSDLHRIGAPVDYYFHDDMDDPAMPDYKMYVMINQFVLSGRERESIFAKARRNHAAIVWLYAPGFVDPGAEVMMDERHIEETVGMKVKRLSGTYSPWFYVDPAVHPAVGMAQPDFRYGFIDREVHSNVWLTSTVLPPAYIDPCFCIDDDTAIVLGRYCHDNTVAYALKEMDGYTSVYCASRVLRSELLASLAEWCGCHLFLRTDDVLYANESFVCVHAKETGMRTVYFKSPCSPFEVYERHYDGKNVTEIEVRMGKGETKMWCIRGSC